MENNFVRGKVPCEYFQREEDIEFDALEGMMELNTYNDMCASFGEDNKRHCSCCNNKRKCTFWKYNDEDEQFYVTCIDG